MRRAVLKRREAGPKVAIPDAEGLGGYLKTEISISLPGPHVMGKPSLPRSPVRTKSVFYTGLLKSVGSSVMRGYSTYWIVFVVFLLILPFIPANFRWVMVCYGFG